MKKIILVTLLIMAKINTLLAQNKVANYVAKTGSGVTFQNAKTQTVKIGGSAQLIQPSRQNRRG
jgi:hypothetical protein